MSKSLIHTGPSDENRRRLLIGSAALTAGLATATNPMLADAMDAQPNAVKNSFKLGEFEVSTLLAGKYFWYERVG